MLTAEYALFRYGVPSGRFLIFRIFNMLRSSPNRLRDGCSLHLR